MGLIDYGAGNYSTFVYAVDNLKKPAFTLATGAYPTLVGFDPAARLVYAQNFDKQLIVYSDTALKLSAYERGVDDILEDRPFLGICLGLQLLFEGSDEDDATMLGAIPGRVRLLTGGRRLPHIGWNQVERRRRHPAFAGIPNGADFYFVHSYAGRPVGPAADAVVLGETTDGGRFVSAIARSRLLGVQFHPERSGPHGLRFLRNVVGLVRDDRFPREIPSPAVEVVA